MWSFFITKSFFKLSSPFSQEETYTSDNVSNGECDFSNCACILFIMWYIRWLTLYHWYQKWALEEWQTTSYSLYMLAFCFLPACGCYSSRRSCPGHSYWSDYLLESFYSYLQINRMYSKGVKATTAISTACTCLTTVYNCVHSNQLPPGLGADVMLQADIFSVYNGNQCGENYRVMESKHF